MPIKFDIIIPVSYKDCHFLKRNIPWIRRNVVSQKIFLLTNKKCFDEFSRLFCEQNSVFLIDENNLIPDLTFENVRKELSKVNRSEMTGWYFQQLLKIGFSFSSYAKEYYLIWDSDTVPLRKIDFFSDESMLINPKKEHHQPYFDTIQRLLGFTNFPNYSFISEHMIVKSSIMREMLQFMGKNDCWWKTILSCCDFKHLQSFSEFETYGSYCFNKYPDLYKVRSLSTLRCGGRLFGRLVSDAELRLLSMDFDTASFERGQYPPFPRSVYARIERILIELKYKYKMKQV